jgi:hypothetical protein
MSAQSKPRSRTFKTSRGQVVLTWDAGQGCWQAPDGRIVTRVRAIEVCDNAHPMRGKGRHAGSYCPGGEDHDREIGWGVYDANGREALDGDVYATLAEAAQEL